MKPRITVWIACCVAVLGVALPVSAKVEAHPMCELVDEQGDTRLVLKQMFDSAGQPDKFSLTYENDKPTKMPDGSAFSVRIFYLGKGAPDAASLSAGLDSNALFEVRLVPRITVDRPAILMFARGDYINIDLGSGKLILPDSVQGHIAAIDTYDRWRAYAEGQPKLTWSLAGTASYNDPIDNGELSMQALSAARAKLLAFAGSFAGKDVRAMPVAFKPGRTCS